MHNALGDECKLPHFSRKNLPDISYDISEDLGRMEMGDCKMLGAGLSIYHKIKFFPHYDGIPVRLGSAVCDAWLYKFHGEKFQILLGSFRIRMLNRPYASLDIRAEVIMRESN